MKYLTVRTFLGDKEYFRIMAMALDKKILLDENCRWLKPFLEDLNFSSVSVLNDLNLPKNATDDDIVRVLHNSFNPKKDQSGYLLLTNNEKDFIKKITPRFDVLVVPNQGGKKLAENIKAFIQFVPKKPQGTFKRMVSNPSPHNTGYDINDISISLNKGKPANNLRRKGK